MIAGATGIDLFLLVIDAQEGARPQTLEHLAVLRLLGVDRGVVAVTKADAVDAETLELALDEARELVPGAEVVAVSAKTGAGLDELRAALARVPVDERRRIERRASTSTVCSRCRESGRSRPGRSGRDDRRRRPAARSSPPGASCGCAACRCTTTPSSAPTPDSASRSTCPASSGDERRPRRRARRARPLPRLLSARRQARRRSTDVPAAVTVHVGTTATAARVVRDGEFAQLRLAEPVVAARGDHVILRTETTVAGGRVLDPSPPRRLDAEAPRSARQRHARRDRARARPRAGHRAASCRRAACSSRASWPRGSRPSAPRASTTSPRTGSTRCAPTSGGDSGGSSSRPTRSTRACRSPSCCRRSRGHRSSRTCSRSSGAARRSTCPGAAASLGERAQAASELEAQLEQEGIGKLDDRQLGAFLEERGRLRRVGDGFAVSNELYDRGRALLATLDPITLAAFRDALGVGRRTAQLLLERYDADGLTLRRGDVRTLRRSAEPRPGLWLNGRLGVARARWPNRSSKPVTAWQPHAGSVRLRRRSVMALARRLDSFQGSD